jgi:hypothetical protein
MLDNGHRSNLTEGRLLSFTYDFGVTVAMLSPWSYSQWLIRGIHPLNLLKMVDFQGVECLS